MPEPQIVELEEADPKAAPTFVAAGVGLAIVVVLVLLLEVLYHRTSEAENHRKIVAEQPLELRSVQATQLEQLNGYRWVDQAQGIAAIPIERAIRLIVEEHGSAEPAPAGRGGE